MKLRPGLERLEAKRLLSTGAQASHVARLETHPAALAGHSAGTPATPRTASDNAPKVSARPVSPDRRQPRDLVPKSFFGYRLTNPSNGFNVNLVPPFGQVLVQSKQPVPGQVYNVLSVPVKNGTAQTFTASSPLTVRFPNRIGAKPFPVLTGNQQWLPNHWIVFYVLTKQYYPLTELQGGFQFDLGGRSTTLVPGPSAIFLRLKYNPATFARSLNLIVAYGQGAQFGKGPPTGIATTNINNIVAGRNDKIDFGGHF